MIVLLVVATAWVLGRHSNHEASAAVAEGQKEIRQSFRLAPGAQVEVRGINGSVDIETTDSDAAEVHIIRTARDSADLDRQQIIVEQTPTSLNIYSKKTGGGGLFGMFHGGQVHNQVMLKLPRRIELTTKGVNGPVKVGELDGAVHLSGINGRVEVAQSANFAEVSGINGGVSIGVARLGADGLKISGINGGVEIRLANDLNADVNVKGLNGSVSLNLPNVTTQEKERSSLHAQLGTGGTPITVSGVNGGVRFVSANGAR
jgi:DUF4097 and DUF4098 domain-containing protein YvlB